MSTHMIETEIKPVSSMRYETIGDYYFTPNNTLKFEVGDTGFDDSNLLILLHELVEYILIKNKNISIEEIDEFDKQSTDEEPGDNPLAPYHKQHIIATMIEKLICSEINLSWDEHDKRIIDKFKEVSNEKCKITDKSS